MHKTFTAIAIILTSIGVLLIVGNFILPHPPPAGSNNPPAGGSANPLSGLQSLWGMFNGGSANTGYTGPNTPTGGSPGPVLDPATAMKLAQLALLA